MSESIQIGILGLGQVGSGALSILLKNGAMLEKRAGKKLVVTKALVKDPNKKRAFEMKASRSPKISAKKMESLLDEIGFHSVTIIAQVAEHYNLSERVSISSLSNVLASDIWAVR